MVGIDDWAWRKGQRYGTIICDLARDRVLDLLPDRNAGTVASRLNAILASRSSRAIVPAFMPRAPVAVLPMQRRSPTAGIFSRTWAKRCVWPSVAIARRSAPPERPWRPRWPEMPKPSRNHR
ncbi:MULTISPECIES: transposase [Mesorhizobium]|uniref:transposase n=1 Tax=Mesorhizobium TaxID=68287 RepID=UPI001AD7F9E8|nr:MULTISPECIES: transposase [Mesorhizobium]